MSGVGLCKAPFGTVFIHEADFGGDFCEDSAVHAADICALTRGFYLRMGGNGLGLFLGNFLESTMTVATDLTEGVHFIAGIHGHCYREQGGKQQRCQHDGGNGDQIPLPGGKQGFEAQAADAATVFHIHGCYPRFAMRPSSMRMIRSAIWAISSLWVIMTMVWENFWLVTFKSPSTS